MQILLTVAYDGTAYAGWQRQNNAIAVQEKLEDALTAVLGRPIIARASSRTDAGVHALGQRATFFVDDLRIPLDKLPGVINGFLPHDIAVTAACAVPDCFNPRFDAVYKTYAYKIHNAPQRDPLMNRYSVHIPRALDVDAMNKAVPLFAGRHDFAAFMATGSSAKTTIREIYDLSLKSEPSGLLTLMVTGNGFLYNMVRIIAGTMLYVGIGKLRPHDVTSIILARDRTRAGKTMPPEGLTLKEVGYTKYSQIE